MIQIFAPNGLRESAPGVQERGLLGGRSQNQALKMAPLILIDTTHGFVSHRYVIRMSNDGERWTIFYQEGGEVRAAEAAEDKVAAFMKAIGAQLILE